MNPAVNFSQDGPPKTVDLPSITLGPSQSSEMHVGRLLHQAGVHGIQGQINLTFEVNAGPGSLLATTGSVDQSGNYVFEVEPSALQTTTTKQISFWSVADGNDTMINLWNPSTKDQSVVLTYFYLGGQYNQIIDLAANASTMTSVRELQMMAKPDASGNQLPHTATTGSAWLSSVSGVEGNLNVIASVGTFNVATATCGTICPTCLGITNVWIAPNPFGWPDLYDFQSAAYTQNTSGGISVATNKATWSSSNSSIASVVSSGMYHGASVGSFSGRASLTTLSPDSKDCVRGQPCPTDTWSPVNPGTVSNLTSSQHTYPNSPLGGPCRVSTCFDCIVNSRTRATHKAQDVAQPTVGALQVGAPIYAAEGGTVALAEGGHPHASSDAATCAGQHYAANYVWISDGHGAITKYVHVSPTVSKGATITAGQQIGTVDISGCSTGAHTHIGRTLNGAVVNFTLPCDNSHFDPAANWIDDTDQ